MKKAELLKELRCILEQLDKLDELESFDPRVTREDEEEDIEQVSCLCKKAVAKFGERHQIAKAIEELNELSRALARYLATDLSGGGAHADALCENIHEELADVLIMGIQLEEIFHVPLSVMGGKVAHLRGLVEMEK